MDINQVLNPIRPFTQLIGTLLMIAGILVAFRLVSLGLPVSGTEAAVLGYLMKAI